jgi:hypothetical protein
MNTPAMYYCTPSLFVTFGVSEYALFLGAFHSGALMCN